MKCLRSLLGSAAVIAIASCLLFPMPVLGDQVIADDLIVQGSACFGLDCVNGENFGDNTIRLKENNTRILFDDTSTTPEDPDQDWWLIANDSQNGGPNMFAISDFTGTKPTNSGKQGIPFATETVPFDINIHFPGTYCTVVGSGGNTNYPPYPDGYFDCPANVEVYNNKPEQLLFLVETGNNSFRVGTEKIWVGTDANPRRLVNVANGSRTGEVITVQQLESAKQNLAFVQGLNGTSFPGMPELQTALADTEQTIPFLKQQVGDVEEGVETNRQAIERNSAAIAQLDEQLVNNQSDLEFLRGKAAGLDTNGNVVASAGGEGSIAIGHGTVAKTRDTAVGFEATVTADASVAIGSGSLVEATNTVAVGADSAVGASAVGATALGQQSRVNGEVVGGIALGQGSENNAAETVSVGTSGEERRITHLDAATNNTDLINRSQLQEAEVRMQAGVERVSEQLDELGERSDQVGALSAALSALVPNERSGGAAQVALGLGHYSGENAVAAGVFVYLTDQVLLNAGISSAFATNSTAGRAGFTISW